MTKSLGSGGGSESGNPMYIELVKYPDVFLRSESYPVKFPLDDKTKRLITWMTRAMYQHHGIGTSCYPGGISIKNVRNGLLT